MKGFSRSADEVSGRQADSRRSPREMVSWPVTVGDGQRILRAETINISPYGAKLRLREPLEPGTQVRLQLLPPDRPSFDVRAIVWRLDADGPALLFLGSRRKSAPTLTASPPAPAERAVLPRGKPTETVLLVDGDSESRSLARGALQGTGYTVLDAGNDPSKAERIAREHPGPIHLLVADIVMPSTNGFHVIEQLASLRPTAKVILLSAYPVAGISASGALFLPKPFTGEELVDSVREVLKGYTPFARPRAGLRRDWSSPQAE